MKKQILLLLMLMLMLMQLVSSNNLQDLLEDTTTTTTTTTTTSTTQRYAESSSRPRIHPTSAALPTLSDEEMNHLMAGSSSTKVTNMIPNMVPHAPPSLKSNSKNSGKFFNKSSPKKRKAEEVSSIPIGDVTQEWKCPNITASRSLECGCDLPHTLRCNGDLHGLSVS